MGEMFGILVTVIFIVLHSCLGVSGTLAAGFSSSEDTELLSYGRDELTFGGIENIANITLSSKSRYSTVDEYRKVVEQLLSGPKSRELYSLRGNCLDHSAALLEKLRAQGFDNIDLAQTSDNGEAIYMQLNDGSTERAYKTHFFLVDRSNGPGAEIIIDPTIYQFLAQKPARAVKSPVFVGDKSDLHKFYSQNRLQTHHDISDPDSDRIGKYSPDELVCLIYSLGKCSKNRTNF
tara:strand:+ start:2843 stop:3544 length:702 start_codon:yes stop_codon:yes gene_type:complete